jgi:hypothetical protein
MVHGETTKRSTLDADTIVARLQARGVEQLREEEAVWVIVDGSDLRKPHARAMEGLQEVKPLRGNGTIPTTWSGGSTTGTASSGRARTSRPATCTSSRPGCGPSPPPRPRWSSGSASSSRRSCSR